MIDEIFDRLDEVLAEILSKDDYTEDEKDQIIKAIETLISTLEPLVG